MKLYFDWNDLPLITHDLPGTGGRIRAEQTDFEVTEIPAYPFAGTGEHLYLFIEKRGHTTKHLVDELCKQTGIRFAEIGVAGLKDRHAVTRQWISVPKKHEPRLAQFSLPDVQILETTSHTNKLGMGHLQGNHFSVRVREAQNIAAAQTTLEKLAVTGVPNYFGPQRFGNTGRNAERGLELVLDAKLRGPESIPVKRFLISSLQSQLFNYYLRLRLERNLFASVLLGEVVRKHQTGGVFVVEDLQAEQLRAANFEISALGPLYGKKTMPAKFAAKEFEEEILREFGLDSRSFGMRKGARRLSRIKLSNANLATTEDDYKVSFDLPKGSFATVVLRELMKVNIDAISESNHEASEESDSDNDG